MWEEAGRRQYGFMHNVEVWEMGGCPLTLRRRTTSKGTEAEEELVGDIMALCIMSKCGGKWVWEEAGKRGAGTGF